MKKINPSQPSSVPSLFALVTSSVLILMMQSNSFAASPLELINVDLDGGQRQTGAAATGLPGDDWNYIQPNGTVANAVDAGGNATSVAVSLSGGAGWGGNDPTGTSPSTVGLLADYTVNETGGAFGGMIPNTNYVVWTYGAGNGNGQGLEVSWTDGVNINTGTNALDSTAYKSSFTNGEDYCVVVMGSDSGGNISYTISPNANQAWISCWNGLQVQLAPTIPVTYQKPPPVALFGPANVQYKTRSAGLPMLTNGITLLSYQWELNGSPLTDNGTTIQGSQTPVLSLSSLAVQNSTISLVVTNLNGATTNSAPLIVASAPVGSYPAQVLLDNPVAYWRMDESFGASSVYEYIHGQNGTPGSSVVSGVAGAPNPPYPGFNESPHYGAQFAVNDTNSSIAVPPVNANTNAVTITGWIKPNGAQNPGTALLLTRTGTGGAGLNYGPTTDTLGYTWNNGSSSTYGWNSGLNVPENIWSFVVLVIDPTKATLYVYNTNSLAAAINPIPNNLEAWSGRASIGSDPTDTMGTNNFNGVMNELTVFKGALSPEQVYALYAAARQSGSVAASIIKQPAPEAVSQGATASFSVIAAGTGPLSYQWRTNGVNLADGGQITGSTSANLLISGAGAGNVANYDCVVTGASGPSATTTAAALTIAPRAFQVNLDINAGVSPTTSGAESVGQAGDVWNGLNANTTMALSDYSGNPSGMGISLTGASFNYDPTTSTNSLMEDYAFNNMTVAISGLKTNWAFQIVAYSAGNVSGQGGKFSNPLIGVLNGGAATTTGNFQDPLSAGDNYVGITDIVATASGGFNLQVAAGPNGSPAILNGLQIVREDISGRTPIIGYPVVGDTNYSGRTFTLSVRAVSDTPIGYQWQQNGVNLANNSHISGANSATLVLNPSVTNDTGLYSCVLTNINGTTLSSTDSVLVVNSSIGWTWSVPVPISQSDYTNIPTGADLTLMLPGRIVGAATFGSTEQLVTLSNGTNIDFTSDGSVATCTGAGNGVAAWSGNTGNTNFNSVLGENEYDNGPHTITMNNLTPGLRYSVQFFANDDRGGGISARQAYFQDTLIARDVSATFRMDANVYVVGTITADNPSETAIQQLPGHSGLDVNAGNSTAVVVRVAPPSLSLVNNGNGTVTVSWNQIAGGAFLQSASSLTGPWTTAGTTGSVTLPTTGNKFFRAVLP